MPAIALNMSIRGQLLSGVRFNPAYLFSSSEPGAWYDPSDLTTLFQNAAGTTPVTAAGQPVGRILDKSGRGNHATQATAASRPTYQIDGFGRPYLSFDGVDDFLVTPTITPGIDKAQVFVGVRRLSDAAVGVLLETSANFSVNNGTVVIQAPNAALSRYSFNSKGTAASNVISTATTAPTTNVLVGIGDIAADTSIMRMDGTQVASGVVDQGTGNYLAYPAYIGRRGGASSPYNGRVYGVILRFGANLDAATISATETWMNTKTGAY